MLICNKTFEVLYTFSAIVHHTAIYMIVQVKTSLASHLQVHCLELYVKTTASQRLYSLVWPDPFVYIAMPAVLGIDIGGCLSSLIIHPIAMCMDIW